MSTKGKSSAGAGGGAALVPKLRFPEFREVSAWEEVPLGASLDYLQPTPYLVSDASYSPAYKIPVLTAGKTFILGYTNEEHGIFYESLPVIIFDDFTTSSQFVEFPFKAKSSAMKILQAKNGSNTKFMFEALQGETHPRLRFPEFEGAEQWEEGTISDIGTVLQGYGFPERYQGQQSGDFPFYKVSDISRSLSEGKTFIKEAVNYVNQNQLKELRAKPILAGTTIFAKIGEAIRSNKRAITTVLCLIDNNVGGVKAIKGKATDFFIYLTMEQISLIDHAGGVVPAVNKSAIEAIPVKFPKVVEQQRIADCLTSLDDLIAAETRKLDTFKIHKKGLMQQLFPSVGEE